MNEKELISEEQIRKKIYTIRNIQVMLDKDLALLYETKPIRLREQVKRNIRRFPLDFMFQLTEKEVEYMVSQNAIPSTQHLGGHLPYVFTEQGVATMSAVLASKRAIEIHIQIMRAFVGMRRFIAENALVFLRLDSLERTQIEYQLETDKRFGDIFNAIEAGNVQPRQGVFFNGQVFEACRFLSDLFRSARLSITVIDNYIDDTVLALLSKRAENVRVVLLTKTISPQLALDVRKFNEQYPVITVREFKDSHDRFIIIDGKTVYHVGASLKDLGKKWFAFSRIEIEAVEMLRRLNEQC